MSEEKALANVERESLMMESAPLDAVKGQIASIYHVMREIMREGQHYGRIPGCGDKPALFKAGAEKLCINFGLITEILEETMRELPNGHREWSFRVGLRSRRTNRIEGYGVGTCSTMETRYRYRQSERICPRCGKEAIIKGRQEYGGGWVCFARKGGCGAKWRDGAAEIEGQVTGRIENPDIADQFNTVKKMALKRAHVDGTIRTVGASDIFTQDIEDEQLGREKQDAPESPDHEANHHDPFSASMELIQNAKSLDELETASQEVKQQSIHLDDESKSQLRQLYLQRRRTLAAHGTSLQGVKPKVADELPGVLAEMVSSIEAAIARSDEESISNVMDRLIVMCEENKITREQAETVNRVATDGIRKIKSKPQPEGAKT